MIVAAVASHPGLVRTENQDSALVPGFCSTGTLTYPVRVAVSAPTSIFAVIDGMGGHAAGQEASRFVAFYLAAQPDGDAGHLLDGANRMLYARMAQNPALTGMGATIAGVRFAGQGATVFNVGDARVYLRSGGYLMLLTTDDRSSSSSSAVTQSLGGASQLTAISPHIVGLDQMDERDRLLVCSDGLTEVVGFDDIAAALAEPDPAAAAAALLRLALQGGAPDNVTLIVLMKQGGP
jgi:PPM family protein phosphatase